MHEIVTVPSWMIRNYEHDSDTVRCHVHRSTDPLEVQGPTESSSGHPKRRSCKPKRGQESGKSSLISGPEELNTKQKSFKRKPRRNLGQDLSKSRKGPDPEQKGHEPSESSSEQNDGKSSPGEKPEPEKLDQEQQALKSESTSEQDLGEASANSGQGPEKSKEPGEFGPDTDPTVSNLCEALEALRIPSSSPKGSKRTKVASKLSAYVAHHTRVGTIHAVDIFLGAPPIREIVNKSNWAETTGGGTSGDADSADEDQDQDKHPSRFPVSAMRSTLLFHPKDDRLELKKLPDRPTVVVVGPM